MYRTQLYIQQAEWDSLYIGFLCPLSESQTDPCLTWGTSPCSALPYSPSSPPCQPAFSQDWKRPLLGHKAHSTLSLVFTFWVPWVVLPHPGPQCYEGRHATHPAVKNIPHRIKRKLTHSQGTPKGLLLPHSCSRFFH